MSDHGDPGNSQYMTGSQRDYSPQKTLVLYNYSLCITGIQQRSGKQIIFCGKHELMHCILERAHKYSEGLSKDVLPAVRHCSYCGSIWKQEKTMSHIKAAPWDDINFRF